MQISNKASYLGILAFIVGTPYFSAANAAPGGEGNPQVFNPNSDALTITNSITDSIGSIGGFVCEDGTITGNPEDCGVDGVQDILYPISGPVYATMVNPSTGETMGAVQERGTVVATPSFDVSFFGLMGDWNALPPTLDWTMSAFQMSLGGSTFEIIDGMELTGRAFPGLGPADPLGSLRMAGCAGVQANNEGRYANKVGSLCLNGSFTFDSNFNGNGVSNCTIVLHDPVQ